MQRALEQPVGQVNKMIGQTNEKHLREQTVPSLRTKLKNMNKLQK